MSKVRLLKALDAVISAQKALKEGADVGERKDRWEAFAKEWRVTWNLADSYARSESHAGLADEHHAIMWADPAGRYVWETGNSARHDHTGASKIKNVGAHWNPTGPGPFILESLTLDDGGAHVRANQPIQIVGELTLLPITPSRGPEVKPPHQDPIKMADSALAQLVSFTNALNLS